MNEIRTITDLRKHCKLVDNSFFSAGNARIFHSNKHHGIYRAPEMPLTEGWIVSESRPDDDAPMTYQVYRFETSDFGVDFRHIGRHESLADAEAFLASMGGKK